MMNDDFRKNNPPPGDVKKKRTQRGESTNDLVFSCYESANDDVFPQILSLFVAPGSKVADVTYGKGVFWRKVPEGLFDLHPTDLSTGIDCRSLPYAKESFSCVVLDPPYMHTPGGSAHQGHQNYEDYYKNNATTSGAKYHEAVLNLYLEAGKEAHRILQYEGFLIVKCQDEVCANQQRLTHVEIINGYSGMGFVCQDLFVVKSRNKPGVSRILQQRHARKNHSYFLVFRKQKGSSRWRGLWAPIKAT
jgi:hypothetical protein